MMAQNPNYWWNMNNNPPSSSLVPPQYVLGSSSSSSSSSSTTTSTTTYFNSLSEIPEPPPPSSWSQLLFTGLPGEEERVGFNHFESRVPNINFVDVMLKQEFSQNSNSLLYGQYGSEEFHHHQTSSHNMVPASSPRSTVTSLSSNNNNLLDFTHHKPQQQNTKNQSPYATYECNSTAVAAVSKKGKSQASSSQPPLKVRKEKLGDRITALHQLVSPFGKTDTASVLLEAIGYIRFLQTQIEALSSPYLGNGSKNMRNHHYVHGERNSVFPEDPGQLLNDTGLKRKAAPSQECGKEKAKDLRSRGLCLVPVSCTQHVGTDQINGADYWAPAFGS